MPVLDDLSGFEFEDVMEDVFRNLGYENVRQAERTADEGRDVLMEEVVDGTRRGVVADEAFTALGNGEMPTAELLDARLLKAGRRPAGVAWRDFVRPFPGAVPGPLRARAGVATPSEDDLRGLRDQTIGQLFAHPFWETFRSRS